MISTNEFFYFDPDYTGQYGDFTDNDTFSADERLDYLREYAAYIRKCNSIGNQPQHVVPPEHAAAWTKQLNNADGIFSTMRAYCSKAPRKFKNWELYTEKATYEDGALVLKDAPLPPNPCAMYHFPKTQRITQLCIQFWMADLFCTELNGRIGDTTPGKTIELRDGIQDVLKVALYANGACYAKINADSPYQAKYIFLGKYRFCEWNNLEVDIQQGSYAVTLNDERTEQIPLNAPNDPNCLFFCTGMFQYGDWKVHLEKLSFDNADITEFWERETVSSTERKEIGEVRLPFAIGGCENADQQLILEKEFCMREASRTFLVLESLDPGGSVFLDGKCIAETDGFERLTVDISSFKANQTHLLTVYVKPRAPEVLYEWHRHKDPYVGWFCEKIHLVQVNRISFDNLRCVTQKVNGTQIEAVFSGCTSSACKVNVSLKQIWNGESEEAEICSFRTEGEFEVKASFFAQPWTPDAPCLYRATFSAFDWNGKLLDKAYIETGFRTITQTGGMLMLNGERIVLKGALQMQFLPPYHETPVTHICPRDEQIVWQYMMLKALGGNTMRLHMLGYGSNDDRYARYADRMGILLIWTTRYIDSVEGLEWNCGWRAKEAFLRQIRLRRNSPSIIMWEGANEFHPNLKQIDGIYDAFVPEVKAVDTTRLLSPISHLYYSADCYPTEGCEYYNDAGTANQIGEPVKAGRYWTDPLVVRSAHPYIFLLGYGKGWDKLRTQDWSEQPNLFKNKERAYVVSEFAVIGRQNPHTREAQTEFFNPYSYEFPDENVLGFPLSADLWEVSQAYQALAAHEAIKQLLLNDADGMLWCCLMGGANDGGYLKPVIDNYGYAKLAFYTMRESFASEIVITSDVAVKRGRNFEVCPSVFGKGDKLYSVTVCIVDLEGKVIQKTVYADIHCRDGRVFLLPWRPDIREKGYYGIQFILEGT